MKRTRIRRMVCIAVLILLLILLPACGEKQIGAPGTWIDGSYEKTVKGKNGSFTVTVTIIDGEISDITVGDNEETPSLGGTAIDVLPAEMIEAQTYDVDGVTGATVTSNALREAVKDCLQQASSE